MDSTMPLSHVTPPLAIGTLQGGEFPDDLLGRANARFFGAIPQASDNPNVLNGNAGSPGKARGAVKVIRSFLQSPSSNLQSLHDQPHPSPLPLLQIVQRLRSGDAFV
jgi:hypothetical protein